MSDFVDGILSQWDSSIGNVLPFNIGSNYSVFHPYNILYTFIAVPFFLDYANVKVKTYSLREISVCSVLT